jgi:DNA-binding transcriptional MocR family regulator
MAVKNPPAAVFLYKKLADEMAGYIVKGSWKYGDRIPSIRKVVDLFGISLSTAVKVYGELEAKSYIEAKPQSGYFVCYSPRLLPSLPHPSKPTSIGGENELSHIIESVFSSPQKKDTIKLSLGVPSDELLPVAKLNKALIAATRNLEGGGSAYDAVEGNSRLRSLIARRSFLWGGQLSEDDMIITSGCINAISYSLMAITEPGDTIAVESPAYFGILQLARSLRLQVIELPTDPTTGIDLAALKGFLSSKTPSKKIKACLFVPSFNNPLGTCMPDEKKRDLVRLLEHYQVPLIEDDLYGDLHFDQTRPKACKSFDKSGMVLWCGSVSKTLAPGYRVGWIAPGKYYEKIKQIKLFHAMSSTAITQEAIAHFLETNSYDRHLQKMRDLLHTNSNRFIKTIAEHFPEGTRVSRPKGGLVLWIELPGHIDTMNLYKAALKEKISIAPGRMFTLQQQFNNCLRLNYALPWNEKTEGALKILGKLARRNQ